MLTNLLLCIFLNDKFLFPLFDAKPLSKNKELNMNLFNNLINTKSIELINESQGQKLEYMVQFI